MTEIFTNYWIVWPVGIAIWLAIGWFEFGRFEWQALLASHKAGQITLSMFCYTVFTKFPLSLFLTGLFVGLFWGALMTHLTWHWCPPGSVSGG